MAKFLDDLYVTGNNANVLVINSDAVADILLVSNTGTVAVGSDNFVGNVYANPKFIINTGSGIPGLMHLNSFGVELVTYTNVSDSLFGNASNHDLTFITNDVERIKITAAGAVGINHLTPPAQLTIVGAGNTSATHALRIGNSASDILVNVQDDGNVGIGTATPTSLLNVVGTSTVNQSFLGVGIDDGAYSAKIGTTNSGGTPYSGLWFDTATPTTTNYQFMSTGGLTVINGSALYLRTSNVDRVIILNNGNVGIGTTSPTQKLHVISTSGVSDVFKAESQYGTSLSVNQYGYVIADNGVHIGDSNGLSFGSSSPFNKVIITPNDWQFNLGSTIILNDGGYATHFAADNATLFNNPNKIWRWVDANIPTSYMSLTTVGLGIGNGLLVPTAKLDVNGDVNISDGLTIDTVASSPTANALRTLTGHVVIDDLSGSGTRTVNVDNDGKLVIGSAPVSGATAKYATTFKPGTVNVANTITHSLGTTDISVTLWDATSGEIILAKVSNRTSTQVDVTFTTNPAGNVRAVIIG